MVGGNEAPINDVAAARAARFGAKREESNNRGVSKDA